MKLFQPTTGGHPLKIDDLLLLQSAYRDGFQALASNLSANQNCILSGVTISTNSSTVTCSSGYAFWQGETYEVLSTSFSFSSSGVYFLKLVSTILPPSPDTYKNLTVNNVHFNRQLQLEYYNQGDLGEYLSAFIRVGSGNILSGMVIDWYGDVTSNFDQTGAGLGTLAGYQICNGNANSPDLRGRFTVMPTNVPSQGAPTLNGTVGTYTFKDIGGEVAHTLNESEIPTIDINSLMNDPGHSHSYVSVQLNKNHPSGTKDNEARYDQTENTSTSTTGITFAPFGGGLPHENRPPYYALIKIIKT